SPAGYAPSSVQNANVNDDKENDSNIKNSVGNVHTSDLIVLTNNGEPVETGTKLGDNADDANDDNNGNMTVDFGFTQSVKIGNLIWIEDDNDGDATTGTITHPPAGTLVTATASNGQTYTGTTDTNGQYLIDVPKNDTYVITVATPTGFVPTDGSTDNSVPNTTAENNKTHDGTGTTVVIGITDNLTLDFGFTPPPAQTVKIGDLVWIEDDNDGDATTGTITHPPVGTIVTAIGSDGTTYTGTTDANGRYEIIVPENDTYTVTVATPTSVIPTLGSDDAEISDTTTENNQSHDGNGTQVIVGTEDNLTVDFGFTPPPVEMVKIGNLIWIENDNDGNATTGTITYPPAGTIVTATGTDGTQYTGTTDSKGIYTITVPENDTYIVTVATPAGTTPSTGSDDNIVLDTFSEENKTHNGKGTTVAVVTEDNLTLDFGFTPLEASISILKTVYGDDDISKGHDAGISCGTPRAESQIVLVDQDKSKDMPVTYCFEVTNTGESYLTDIAIIDETLGITHAALTLLNGPAPAGLESGASLLYYYEVTLTESLTNVATVTAIPSDEEGKPTGETVTSEDPSTAKVTLIIDPPSGLKTVTASGAIGMEWQMVWINDSDVAAPGVTVFDEVPV
ncbi:MAG: hypothetical protein KAG66_07370, partial [Methylococcales bacterium]|nr:hypothetical protein [Methylococcales bacterium]